MNKNIKWSVPLHERIKQYRVVSISALIFLGYCMESTLSWVMTSNPETLGAGVAVSGIIGGLIAGFKFVFEFATFNENRNK